jgi:membrane protein DedA with SNARE-associated domain
MTKRRTKIILILITSCIAILIISSTLGRELYEGRGQSLTSFGLVHFSGYLFFLLMPVELAYIYYLNFFSEVEMISVALATATAAQIIDYYIGLSMNTVIVNNLVGEKRILNAENHILNYGYLIIFIFNLFPLSSPVISVAAGMLKFRFKIFIIYSTVGLIIKYIVLTLIF